MTSAVQIIVGDCRKTLAALPDKSVQMVMTSPPYFGLRDYGTVEWEGGDPAHEHDRIPARGGRGGSGAPGKQTEGSFPSDLPAPICSCGAKRIDRQIGLETTPDDFVEAMVTVFREVWRVLRDDGTLWLNLGDSYAAGGNGGHTQQAPSAGASTNRKTPQFHGHKDRGISERVGVARLPPDGLKPKDLIGIPWRVAFALQADGWYLRQDIIWAKPNPMPESVRDRCTKAHEYVFLFSKNGTAPLLWRHRDTREFVYDRPGPDYIWRHIDTGEEVRATPGGKKWKRINLWSGMDYYYDADAIAEPAECGRLRGSGPMVNAGTGRGDATITGDYRVRKSARKRDLAGKTKDQDNPAFRAITDMRNKRSVWTVTTKAFPEAHFATFPPALVEPCVLAGSPMGGIVLDPFGGAGTTGMVAARHHRDSILLELNPGFAKMAHDRIQRDGNMLVRVTTKLGGGGRT